MVLQAYVLLKGVLVGYNEIDNSGCFDVEPGGWNRRKGDIFHHVTSWISYFIYSKLVQFSVYLGRNFMTTVYAVFFICLFVCFVLLKYLECWWMSLRQLSFCCRYPPSSVPHWWFPRRRMRICKTKKSFKGCLKPRWLNQSPFSHYALLSALKITVS